MFLNFGAKNGYFQFVTAELSLFRLKLRLCYRQKLMRERKREREIKIWFLIY